MAPIVTVSILTLRNHAARQQVIDQLSKLQAFSLAHEPGVIKHCLTVPRDTSDTKSLYVLEEYASQTAFDMHMASPEFKASAAWCERNSVLFEDPTQVLTLEPFCGFTRTNRGDPATRDPFITLATFQYQDAETARNAQSRWKQVATITERNEKRGTLGWQVLRQGDEESILRSIEVFENERWREARLRQEHVRRSKEVDEREGRKWCTVLELRAVGGFLGREGRVRSVL